MASITHLKAQYLLQAAADSMLTPLDKSKLDDHLTECQECRQYAKHLSKLQDDLRRVTRYRWNQVGIPLSIEKIRNRTPKVDVRAYRLRTIGKLSVAVAVLALVFILVINVSSTMKDIPAAVGSLSLTPEKLVLTPTPSIKGTVTDTIVQECTNITYVVQENDTLESIAARHSVSKQIVKEYNGLATDILTKNMVLVIPLCDGTPANSTMTPTTTSTTTP
jgi:LysM repeat protein